MPGDFLDALDTATEVALPGGSKALVLRLEVILAHRIEEFVATGHIDVARQAIALMLHPGLDEERLRDRAAASHHDHAVDAIRELTLRVEAGERLETDELHRLADKLLAEWSNLSRTGFDGGWISRFCCSCCGWLLPCLSQRRVLRSLVAGGRRDFHGGDCR
jgi:hypothetical protein